MRLTERQQRYNLHCLEAMQERQVTIGDTTFKLDEPFLVMATQNPVEQEGTYPLPEAQVDRFMLKAVIDYPKVRRRTSHCAPELIRRPMQQGKTRGNRCSKS